MSKVFIVIVTWNGLQDTLECLQSLNRLDHENRHVIVVDNASIDNSAQVIRAKYPHITLFRSEINLGYSGANNLALRYALEQHSDYAWLVNNDTIVAPESLSRLVARAEQHENLGLISPVIHCYYKRESVQRSGTGYLVDRSTQRVSPVHKPLAWGDEKLSNLVLWGTALLLKCDAVRRIGFLDDRYFAYWEDVDYSLRALDAGFQTFIEPNAVVYHKGARSLGQDSPICNYLGTRNIYWLWAERLRGWNKCSYSIRYLARSLEYAASRKEEGAQAHANAYLDGAWDALLGHYGPWRQRQRMPDPLRKILNWHPYFWVALLKGDFRKIVFEGSRRILSIIHQRARL